MKPLRFALLAALVAALFVLVPSASADCPPGDPECGLLPPESEQVNPDPTSGAGPEGELGAPGLALPVQAVIPMPLPAVAQAILPETPVEAAPSFSKLEIPLRYQQPGDVSCGVQALGMALDGLDGPAPTSSALLGFLQDNGMMYDFGTGVEELAYAAQSLGYGGSYAFHGATLDDLAAQLAGGSPVVVSLGANGEGEPGHFVTVTGISPDGQWVSYNDPTLGEQVMAASEFMRLWGMQGNSGVAVLKEVPPGVPDYSGYVALMAGLMALVSATPLGAKRYGVGGRVDSGGGGSKAAKPAPKPAPAPARKPAPTPAPKAAAKPAPAPKPATVATPAPRVSTKEEKYGGEPAIAPVVKVTPKVSLAPKARFDEEPPVPAPKVAKARFDEEPLVPTPKPAVVSTPVPKPVVTTTPAPKARFDEEPFAPVPGVTSAARARFDEEPLAPAHKITSAPQARFDEEPIALAKPTLNARYDRQPPPTEPSGTGLLWTVWSAVVDLVGNAAQYLAEHPKIGPLTLPIVIPGGFGLSDEGAVVLYRLIDEISPLAVRSIGRGVDEVLGPLAWPAGWALTVAPSQIENEVLDAPMHEREADLELDTYGFVLAEALGDIAFLLTAEFGPISIPFGAATDLVVGAAYDTLLERSGFRDAYVAMNEPRPDELPPEPVPTPGLPTLRPEETPHPPDVPLPSQAAPQATGTEPGPHLEPQVCPVPEP